MTLDLGLRYDRQWGEALASETASNSAFPNLVPGINFTGYEAPFHWNNLTPRVGVTYALDEARKTIFRASFSRNAGQLTAVGTYIGYANPSSTAGYVEYPWADLNGDHLAQTNEVQRRPAAAGVGRRVQHRESDLGGLGQSDRSGLQGAGQHGHHHGPGSRAEAESRGSGQLHLRPGHRSPDVPVHWPDERRLGTGGAAIGTTPDGVAYSIPLFIPDANKVAAVGGGRLLTNFEGYATVFNGFEVSMTKRMSDRWMARLATSWNNPTEDYDMNPAVNENGNPTRTDTFPLISGGQWAPRSAGSGSGDVFINQRWNFNVNGVYQLPWQMEVAGNLFGKQGTPLPYFVNQALGREGTVASARQRGARFDPVRQSLEPGSALGQERLVRRVAARCSSSRTCSTCSTATRRSSASAMRARRTSWCSGRT